MEDKLSGKFIVLDGPDGCGKTTQAKLLLQWLQEQDVPTVSFRDPGDTAVGEKIRQIRTWINLNLFLENDRWINSWLLKV